MPGFNKVILMGNCAREPELRYTPGGTAVTDFTLAVNRVYGSGEARKQETLFIGIEAWGKTAETLGKYFKKGDLILIEGRLVLDQWEANGEKRSKVKVVAENFQFMPRTNAQGTGTSSRMRAEETPDATDDPGINDDVPF